MRFLPWRSKEGAQVKIKHPNVEKYVNNKLTSISLSSFSSTCPWWLVALQLPFAVYSLWINVKKNIVQKVLHLSEGTVTEDATKHQWTVCSLRLGSAARLRGLHTTVSQSVGQLWRHRSNNHLGSIVLPALLPYTERVINPRRWDLLEQTVTTVLRRTRIYAAWRGPAGSSESAAAANPESKNWKKFGVY